MRRGMIVSMLGLALSVTACAYYDDYSHGSRGYVDYGHAGTR